MPSLAAISHILFWVSAGMLGYVYAGYPILLGFLTKVAPRPTKPCQTFLPKVTLLISTYNESPVIAAKLENSLALDYPKEMLEIIVISDCSDDGTDERVAQYSSGGVRLVRQPQRLGKAAGLNLAAPQATGEILVFSDANALYLPDAIRQLVRHFSDPQVGYAVGNARYVEKGAESASAQSESLYWKLEIWLKRKESLFQSVVGGDGAIYAIRRKLYTPLLPTDINDFLNPLQIIDRGYVGVFEPAAICYEEAAGSFALEFRRKVRIVSRSLNALRRVPGILNPLRQPRHWFLLISHKLLRWWAPVFMTLMFAASLEKWDAPFFRMAASLQVAFYGLALLGWKLENRFGTWKLFTLPCYFCLVNIASFIGCFKCLRGDLSGTWVPPRQKAQSKA